MQVEAVSVAGNACLCPQIILEDVPHDNILLAAGNVVQSVSISSGNLQGTYRAHSDLVSAMCTFQGAANNTLMVSASFDGQVDVWDPVSMTTLQSFQLGRPVVKLFNTSFWIEKTDEAFDKHSSARVDCVVALVRSANPEKKSFEILKITVSDLLAGNHAFALFGSTLTPRLEVFAFDAASTAGNGSASSVKTYSALVANGKKGLNFMICAEREGLSNQQLSVYYSMNDPVIAFATNSSAGSVAVGHDNGQLSLLTNVSEFLRQFWQLGQKRSSEILAATHHWHSHPVLSLCFSPDGRLLYSGGEENVLVIWDLKDAGRNYLPRLGAPISRIIACQSVHRLGRVLVTTVDNTLRLVNVANFEVEWLWQSASISTSSAQLAAQRGAGAGAGAKAVAGGEGGAVVVPLTKASIAEHQRLQLLRSLQAYRFHDDHAERAWFAQCLVNPRTGYLLINGSPGVMQEFDFRQGVIRQNHPLLQHHRVSRKDPGMRMFLPSITRFAVDASGRLLVTIDVKRGEELPKEYSLKIWEWFADDAQQQPQGAGAYRIVAQLDKPHGDFPVTSLAVSQQQPQPQQPHEQAATNDQLLQHVMIVTGSSDGTLKLWTRKAADDVHDMYNAVEATSSSSSSAHKAAAPSSSSSRSNTATSSSSSAAAAAAAAANDTRRKAYALHQLRWKCHYAFQYRVAPVLAVTFSLDASLLVVAHDNLITCWDPQTVSLRASLTLTQPRKVTHLSVIEPRAAAEYGQGVGDVYLVAGTNASVTVFSLLTQQALWTVDGEAVEAIATASSEQFALTAAIDGQHRFRSSLAEEGWIAIATTTTAAAAAESDGDTDAEDGEASSSLLRRPQCHTVAVFSPVSATPLLTERVALASKVTSLAFLRRTTSANATTATATATATAASGVMGLAVLTSDSDVWLVQPREHPCHFTPGVTASVGATSLRATAATTTSSSSSSSVSSSAAPLAQVKTAALPTVAWQPQPQPSTAPSRAGNVVDTAGDLSGRVVSANKAVAPMGRAIVRKDWLRALLPENTEDLPKISEIAGSYLRSMVTNHAPVNRNSHSSHSSSHQWASSTSAEPAPAVATRSTAASSSSMTRVASVQDTDDLLRRVSAKWASVLGKRSAEQVTTATATAPTAEEASQHRTPSKKSKKDTTTTTAATTTPVAAAAAAAAAAEDHDASAASKSKSRSASKKAAASSTVPPVATAAPPAATVAAALPPLPEHEEVSLPAPTTATATRTSSRKRKGSDLGSVASSVDEDDNDDVSDAASTATDITTPSVAAARRSARQKTMSLVAMAPASSAAAAPAAAATRATRSRK